MSKKLFLSFLIIVLFSFSVFAKKPYLKVEIKPSKGNSITAKYPATKFVLSRKKKVRIEAVVVTAREWLEKVTKKLNEKSMSEKVKKWANKYFKTDLAKGPLADDLKKIKKAILDTSKGINKQLPIKIYADKGVYGYVNIESIGKKVVRMGDVHVSPGLFSEKKNLHLAIVTFIHEATHRFAGTDDFGDKGYIDNDGNKFWKSGITKSNALENADSYAWFIYKIISGE